MIALLGPTARGLFLFSFLTLAPAMVHAQPVPDIDGVIGEGGGSSQQPGVSDLDPARTIDDTTSRVENGGDSGSYVGDYTGGRHGFDDIDDSVMNALAADPVRTGLVTLGLVGLTLAGYVFASRYVDPKVALRSPERSMLYGYVKGNPGVHLKQLSTAFSMKTSTVLWHIRKLEAADLVRSKKANGYRVFYPVSGGIEASRLSEAVTALSNANARSIFSLIAQAAGALPRDLTAALGLNPGTVRWHLKRLREAGLLEEVGERRDLGFRPTELGLKALQQLQGVSGAMAVPATVTPGENPNPELSVAG